MDDSHQTSKVTLRFLVSRVREKGVFYCLKAALRLFYYRMFTNRDRFVDPLRFVINLFKLARNSKPKKILLGVWDYKTVPWTVGDLLFFIETLSVLKLKHGADKVDICVVCDNENPPGNRGSQNITPNNYRYYLFNLLPAITTSPYLGSVFQFDSRAEFYSFLKQSRNKYIIYPPIKEQLAEVRHIFGGDTLLEIEAFYREHAFIPYLAIDEYHLSWAYNFYKTKAKGLLPVAVSLRWNPWATRRNAERAVWLGFFDLCQSAFPEVVFVVVGTREEVFEELRHRPNVIVAKDQGSTLLDDLALIRTSLLYMGMESGISEIAVFSDVPYLLFGREEIPARKALGFEPDTNYEFATPYQKAFYASSFSVTPESLLREFSNLYHQLDVNKWRKKASESKPGSYSFAL